MRLDKGLEWKRHKEGAGDMAQWLKALAALAEDLGLIPRTHVSAHNVCYSSPRDRMPSPDLPGHQTYT